MTTPLFAGPGQESAKHVQDPLEGGPRTPFMYFASKGGVTPLPIKHRPPPPTRIAHARIKAHPQTEVQINTHWTTTRPKGTTVGPLSPEGQKGWSTWVTANQTARGATCKEEKEFNRIAGGGQRLFPTGFPQRPDGVWKVWGGGVGLN